MPWLLHPRSLSNRITLLCLFAILIAAASLPAQTDPAPGPGRLILILPFENKSGQPALSWIGDSFPDTLNQRLNSAGFLTITRDDRLFALDHLGLPPGFRPSRATTLRIAQTLDVDYVIVGNYNVINADAPRPATGGPIPSPPPNKPQRITVQARVIEVNRLAMSSPIEDSAEIPRLLDVQNAIAWKIARQIDPHFNVALQTFLSASAGVKLSAFENYIRGIVATTPQERVKRLQLAIQDTPNYSAALLALGKTQYAERNYDQAAANLARVPPNDRLALEGGFYLGLAHFNSAKYVEAEAAFFFVAARLPLPEVINNQAVAVSRQNRDAIPLFQRASAVDPNDADYHYNLAVSYYRRGDFAAAQRENTLALNLHPTDSDARQLNTRIAAGRAPVKDSGFVPLERIRRTWSETEFRQAAFQLDQLRAARMATLPSAQQAAEYLTLGQDYLRQGLLPEAEQQFQSALAADPKNSTAHAGLAQIRELSAGPAEARDEAHASIKLSPNATAYLVLARLDIKDDQLAAAASSVAAALRLEPANATALTLKQTLLTKGQALP